MTSTTSLTTPNDYAAVLDLLARVYAACGPRVYLSFGEFEHRWRTVYPAGHLPATKLWWHEQRVVGLAWLDGRYTLLVSAPGHAGLEPQLLTWAEANLPTGSAPLLAYAFTQDAERASLLAARGYSPTDRAVNLRSRDVAAPLPEPAIPPGYRLRHVANEADIVARAAVYERAFPDEQMPPELHRAVTQATCYRPDLDLLIDAPDGAVAAFATIWFDPQHRLGVFEPVGCDPAHQRRGLARALMLAGLQRLHALGATTALVSTGASRPAANELYESCGFRLVDRLVAWERPHPRGPSPCGRGVGGEAPTSTPPAGRG